MNTDQMSSLVGLSKIVLQGVDSVQWVHNNMHYQVGEVHQSNGIIQVVCAVTSSTYVHSKDREEHDYLLYYINTI